MNFPYLHRGCTYVGPQELYGEKGLTLYHGIEYGWFQKTWRW